MDTFVLILCGYSSFCGQGCVVYFGALTFAFSIILPSWSVPKICHTPVTICFSVFRKIKTKTIWLKTCVNFRRVCTEFRCKAILVVRWFLFNLSTSDKVYPLKILLQMIGRQVRVWMGADVTTEPSGYSYLQIFTKFQLTLLVVDKRFLVIWELTRTLKSLISFLTVSKSTLFELCL